MVAVAAPYQRLACALIERAIEDLNPRHADCTCASRKDGRCKVCRSREDAVAFFRRPERSDVWMDAAGINGDEARIAMVARGILPR